MVKLPNTPINITLLFWNFKDKLEYILGQNIELTMAPNKHQLWVVGDPDLLQNILVSFGIHARQVMKEGGNVLLACSSVTLDKEAAKKSGVAPGNYCEVVFTEFANNFAKLPVSSRNAINKATIAEIHSIISLYRGRIRLNTIVQDCPTFWVLLPEYKKE